MTKLFKKNKYNWKEIGFLISVGIFPLANFLVFYIYLNFDSFLLAFRTTSGNSVSWGFENFRIIFEKFTSTSSGDMGELLLALKNTAIWCLITLWNYIPTMLTTYFVFKKVKGSKFIAFMTMLPTLLPAAAYVGFVKYIISTQGGLGYFYATVFDDFAPALLRDSLYANKTMIVYTLWMALGMSLLWNGAMNNISPEILEAGKIDGTTWFSELTRIIIPLIWPTLSVNLMFTVAGLLGASGPILVFTNGKYGTTTLSFWIFSQVKYGDNVELPATMGLLMTCISVPLVLLVRRLAEKVEVY